MHMDKLTEMERWVIEEQLLAEDICARKVQLYMSVTRDPAVQAILQQMAEQGQRHVSTLDSLLHDSGLTAGVAQH